MTAGFCLMKYTVVQSLMAWSQLLFMEPMERQLLTQGCQKHIDYLG
jgi:hypothetical protein